MTTKKKPIAELESYAQEIAEKITTMKQQSLFLSRGDEFDKMASFIKEASSIIESFSGKMRAVEKSGEIGLIAKFSGLLHDLNYLSDNMSEVMSKKKMRRNKNIVPQMAAVSS
ncbi:MAG TPA: hypothetical protein P5230_03935 [Candidatus Magasanikbacteria bacterium]|nr:hypothetical protein [Candidatus Magasanikbacteria bacterium]